MSFSRQYKGPRFEHGQAVQGQSFGGFERAGTVLSQRNQYLRILLPTGGTGYLDARETQPQPPTTDRGVTLQRNPYEVISNGH